MELEANINLVSQSLEKFANVVDTVVDSVTEEQEQQVQEYIDKAQTTIDQAQKLTVQFTYYLWVKSLKTGSVMWASFCALSYFYMVSAWGGYVFIINLIPLHVLALIIIGRYSSRLFVAYTTFYCWQLFFPCKFHSSGSNLSVLPSTCQLLERLEFFRLLPPCNTLALVSRLLSFTSLLFGKIHIPIIASVSEHQPTTWVSFFFDLHITAAVFPVGLWYCVKNVNDERVFIILYAVSAVYFAGVMVRLMLTLTPVVCALSGIAFSYTFEKYFRDDEKSSTKSESDRQMYDKVSKKGKTASSSESAEDGVGINSRSLVSVVLVLFLLMFVVHATYVTSNAYSHPSVVLQSSNSHGDRIIMDDFREAYHWLRENTADDARIMSWWDYGYQIAGMANRTTLVDNNTWNNSHIALVGKAMSSNESAAHEIMNALDVDYVLIIFGGVIGYSGDDFNKFLWMVRIAEGGHPKEIKRKILRQYITPEMQEENWHMKDIITALDPLHINRRANQ
ncbi:unnamed protein product [Cylicocyclus nassatus]|uniref:dolichyl-diphosphooligosaccharide--protein glycotransferase n=1 Tax=Cylicocyclus nassatus TaxID=53992 RepID=A0AA36DV59_CYLNA|nr:unnamed protein product [Cylicocyclus nassatus]